jgi:hypothetical protein
MHVECHEFRADPELAIRRGYSRTTKNAKATKSGGFETRPYIFAALGFLRLDFSYFVIFLPFVVIFVFQVAYPREGLCS